MMTIHRANRPWVLFLLLFVSLLLLFAPFTHHGSDNRQRLKGVINSVKTATQNQGLGLNKVDESWGEADKMREWEFNRALQYEGTGSRIQAFIDKARSGRPFTVSVIGGSVSKGRGLKPPPGHLDHHHIRQDEQSVSPPSSNLDITEAAPKSNPQKQLGATTLYSKENLHVMIFDWLNATFPNPGNRFVNGAQGGVGAGYFGWCFKEHIPEDSDLILVEQGINDLLEMEVISLYEHLLRGLLELPNKPAVINVETFTTLFPSLLSSSAFHQGVLNFYDVPSIAIRDVILPRLLADPNKQMPRWFRTGEDVTLQDPKTKEYGGIAVDVMHISARGHALAAGLVIRYLQDQIERSAPPSYFRKALSRFASSYIKKPPLRILDVPSTSLTGQFDPFQRDSRHIPVCRSENSGRTHGKISSAQDDHSAGQGTGLQLAEGSHGWTQWAWAEKRYLISKEPGSIAIFDFVISPPSKEIAESKESLLLAESDPMEEGIEGLLITESDYSNDEEDTELEAEEDSVELRHEEPKVGSDMMSAVEREIMDSDTESRRFISNVNKRQNRGSGGSVFIGYQRSAHLGLGSVWCWVDDDRIQGTQVDGWWKLDKRNMGMVKEVASGLQPGKHTLQCEVLKETLDPSGGNEFRLFAVMHD
uniref:SGNH hydrolase-type esterase domain-containing protein n=1 Tax=Kwoniella dejecticola CBS 10117 TaxID=1296121 RepID=A0A1A6A9H5_9TREE|nr:uncharacterized protein I303_02727 [Kwoniella dejecticola CBS 10117]OBR86715.1 hypothetical protein I303_02727 [Kwoniella dejecticola CBS 10117]